MHGKQRMPPQARIAFKSKYYFISLQPMTTLQDLKRLGFGPEELLDVILTQAVVILDVSNSKQPSLMFIVHLKQRFKSGSQD